MATATNDTSKLPKWAQVEIGRLQGNIEYLQAKLSAGPESRVVADCYSESPQYIKDSSTIRFHMGDRHDDYVDVRLDGDEVVIMAGYVLQVRPQSSNVVRVINDKNRY